MMQTYCCANSTRGVACRRPPRPQFFDVSESAFVCSMDCMTTTFGRSVRAVIWKSACASRFRTFLHEISIHIIEFTQAFIMRRLIDVHTQSYT